MNRQIVRRAAIGAAVALGLLAGGTVFAAAPATVAGTSHPLLVGLHPGQQGPAVATLQADLQLVGYSQVPVDGVFGSVTQAAVQSFETANGLSLDGATTLAFRAALLEALGWSPAQVNGGAPNTGANSGSGSSLATLEASHPAVSQLLAAGSMGHWVATLQADLALVGYGTHLSADGMFGPATTAAVDAFQQTHGLPVTGSSTPDTWHALLAALGLVPPFHGGPMILSTAGSNPSASNADGSTGSTETIDGRPVLQVIHMTATAYGPSLQDNYPYGPVDYFGQPLEPGMVAVDPSVIPLGSYVYVSGYSDANLPSGGFLGHAMDTGGAIQGDRIDIYMDAGAQTVSNFGIEPVTVYVLGN